MTPFAALADITARYPDELVVLAADPATGLQVDARVEAALIDASAEMRAILAARYTPAEIARLDEPSRDILRAFAIHIALYRVALSFARQTEAIKERYDIAIKRLEAIAAGRGGLGLDGGSDDADPTAPGGAIAPNEAVVDAPERVMTRQRLGGW